MRLRALSAIRPSWRACAVLIIAAVLPGCGPSSSDSDDDGGGAGSGGSGGGDDPIVSLTLPGYLSDESAPEVRIAVGLSSSADVDITVPFQLGGTASASGPDADYLLPNGQAVTIPAGSFTTEIVVVPVADDLDEGDETIFIQLGTPSLGTLGALSQTTVTLQDSAGSAAPFGDFLLLAASAGSPSNTQVHTANDGDGTTLRVSPIGYSILYAALAPGGQYIAFDGGERAGCRSGGLQPVGRRRRCRTVVG